MRIAFWGTTKECGTTLNMYVLAAMMAYVYPNQKVRLCRMKTPAVYQARPRQIPENSRLEHAANRTEQGKNCTKDTTNHTEYPISHTENRTNHTGSVTTNAGQAEVTFLDCGNRQDAKARKIIRQADLVVVNLIQERRALDSLFLNHLHLAENVVFLVGNYSEFSHYDRAKIENIYRIWPNNLGLIPYNNEFCYAYENGKISDYLKHCLVSDVKNQEFFREVRFSLEILLRKQEKEANI